MKSLIPIYKYPLRYLEQPNNEKQPRFPYRPEIKFFAIFVALIVSIPVVCYYFLLPTWSWTKSEEFQNIKGALVKYGSVSSKDAENFSIKNITDSNIHTWEAIHLTQDDLVGLHLLKFILPLIVVLGIFIALYLKLQIPGVTRRVDLDIRKREEEYLDHIQDKTYDSLKSYNAVIISVNGFIISVLGFFLVSSSAGTPGGGNF